MAFSKNKKFPFGNEFQAGRRIWLKSKKFIIILKDWKTLLEARKETNITVFSEELIQPEQNTEVSNPPNSLTEPPSNNKKIIIEETTIYSNEGNIFPTHSLF